MKLWRGFMWLFVLSGFPLLAWVGYFCVSETYGFWRHGVEKNALVVALDHTRRSARSGSATYYYEIEIDGRRTINEFHVCLPVGKSVSMLVLPTESDAVVPGTRYSNPFEIFSNLMGGDFMAVLIIGMLGFMAWTGPKALVEWIGKRKEIIYGPDARKRQVARETTR